MTRVVCWFSCGAASAVAAKLAIQKYKDYALVEIVYCDTSADEHPDNKRFLEDVEKWLGQSITVISSDKFNSVEEVWDARKYMAGIKGAPCTVEMKKVPRFNFQIPGDINVFGFTADEHRRIKEFELHNPDLILDWVLLSSGVTKQDCFKTLLEAGIIKPRMYQLGFKNNNCIGCVKASSPKYWLLVKKHFPEVFRRRQQQEERIGAKLTRRKIDGKWEHCTLTEMLEYTEDEGTIESVSCGPDCRPTGVE